MITGKGSKSGAEGTIGTSGHTASSNGEKIAAGIEGNNLKQSETIVNVNKNNSSSNGIF